MIRAHDYARQNTTRFQQQLKELLRIPSISTSPEHRADVQRAAEWIAADMRRIGFTTVEIIPTRWHPVVYAEWLGAGPDAPTVLIYCHYDVQPAAINDGWHTLPFEPTEHDGKIYARGAIDSKSNVVAQLKAAEAMLATGGSPVNLKLMFEGDEETTAEAMTEFVTAHHDRLKADVCIVCDGSMADREQPDIAYALRGILEMELEVFGPRQDLHSGHYGGTVHNPIQALAEIITQLHNPDGSIAVPGFYDDVLSLEADERAELAKALPLLEADWHEVTAAPKQWGEPDYNLHERIGARPTLEINGITGGFVGEGFKTVLPGKALAKISCRLVANQQCQAIFERVHNYVAQITPSTVRADLRLISTGEASIIDRQSSAVQALLRANEKSWGKRPMFMREGGSIPVVVDLQRELHAQIVLMSPGYGGGAHGPNEHVYLDIWHRGIDTILYFCDELAKETK
jgi:acetylornithine deacetylase/succinyl-diaminopimelate desuccinylase-like protein